jgi:DNA-directed RNA polymerase specialized sigma24 family protein
MNSYAGCLTAVAETAAVLGISQAAVKTRHLRALERLRDILGHNE